MPTARIPAAEILRTYANPATTWTIPTTTTWINAAQPINIAYRQALLNQEQARNQFTRDYFAHLGLNVPKQIQKELVRMILPDGREISMSKDSDGSWDGSPEYIRLGRYTAPDRKRAVEARIAAMKAREKIEDDRLLEELEHAAADDEARRANETAAMAEFTRYVNEEPDPFFEVDRF
jgi:hypothetical protein